MRLIIVRHGDPDYEHDTLTEKGHREAKLLADRLAKIPLDACYVSPLGRAQATAGYTLKAAGKTAETLDWLREFHAPIDHPDTGDFRVPWDWLPSFWTEVPEYFDKDHWFETADMRAGRVGEEAARVAAGIDGILAQHGYRREHNYYRVERANTETIVLFCHFGVECVLLGHLLGASPMVFWQGFCAAPTGVTIAYTEERRKGVASFRVTAFGDTGHLYIAGEEPSFSARFCECYDNADERHD